MQVFEYFKRSYLINKNLFRTRRKGRRASEPSESSEISEDSFPEFVLLVNDSDLSTLINPIPLGSLIMESNPRMTIDQHLTQEEQLFIGKILKIAIADFSYFVRPGTLFKSIPNLSITYIF